MLKTIAPCQCSDPGCSGHAGKSTCPKSARRFVQRFDMSVDGSADELAFCVPCAEDAYDSGMFI